MSKVNIEQLISSNINEVTNIVLNFLLFCYEQILHAQKSTKKHKKYKKNTRHKNHQKALKALKHNQAKAQKRK